MFNFYTPWKHQKTCGFFMSSEGIEVLVENVLIIKILQIMKFFMRYHKYMWGEDKKLWYIFP